jgi:hypothetical protein
LWARLRDQRVEQVTLHADIARARLIGGGAGGAE